MDLTPTSPYTVRIDVRDMVALYRHFNGKGEKHTRSGLIRRAVEGFVSCLVEEELRPDDPGEALITLRQLYGKNWRREPVRLDRQVVEVKRPEDDAIQRAASEQLRKEWERG